MASDIETVLAALNEARVRYLIVGGVAVVLHGHLRTTADLDLVLQLERTNVLRALESLERLGYAPRAPVPAQHFADPKHREAWAREKNMTVFSLWSSRFPTLEIDLFLREPFDFDAVFDRSVTVRLQHADAPVIARADLIELKQSTGRPRDLQDVKALRDLDSQNESGTE